MTCAEAREALLSADLADLEAASGPVPRHLASCASCRADADRLLAGHAALRLRMGEVMPARASAGARAIAAGRAVRRSRRRRMGYALAAAAGVAVVLLVPRDHAPDAPSVRRVELAPTPPPLVAAAEGRLAVITTRRPDITVVWQF